jgi:hypothetical protein
MASQANLTINDGQATPVAHTFYTNGAGWSESLQGILASWVDRSAAAAVGFWKVSMSFKEPNGKQRKNYVVVAKSSVPVLENVTNSTVSGIAPAPMVSYNPVTTTTFTIPERSSTQARKDQLAIHRNFLANAVITSAIQDLEPTT